MWKIMLVLLLVVTACAKEKAPSGQTESGMDGSSMTPGTSESPATSSPTPSISASAEGSSPNASASPTPSVGAAPSTQPEETASASGIDADSLPHTFAFADEDGKRLITYMSMSEKTDTAERLHGFDRAIGDNGTVLTVRYKEDQQRSEQDNGRQTSGNFDNLEGSVFEVAGGAAVPNATYYLVSSSEFATDMLLSVTPAEDYPDMEAKLAKQTEEQAGHKIEKASKIAVIGGDSGLYAVKFKREADQMLAALVLETEDGLAFKYFPAEYNESSVWRVDDNGELPPDLFSLMFAAQGKTGMIIAVKWLGFEGENQMFYQADGESLADLDVNAGRYMSPA